MHDKWTSAQCIISRISLFRNIIQCNKIACVLCEMYYILLYSHIYIQIQCFCNRLRAKSFTQWVSFARVLSSLEFRFRRKRLPLLKPWSHWKYFTDLMGHLYLYRYGWTQAVRMGTWRTFVFCTQLEFKFAKFLPINWSRLFNSKCFIAEVNELKMA